MTEMFEKAARLKIRFPSARGEITVEDLWDLPLTSTTARLNLDSIAVELHKKLKSGDAVSFVNPDKKSNEIDQLRFDLIKHVIEVKIDEQRARADEVKKSAQKQKILHILSQKQDASLEGKSEEELKKMLEEL